MRTFKIIIGAVLVLALGIGGLIACENMRGRDIGTIVGAGTGAALGSQIGGGATAHTVGAVGGAVAGGVIGHEVGKSMEGK